MKIAILGYGKQGRSAFEYWNTPENQITICDPNMPVDLPDGVDVKTDGEYLSNLEEFDLLVRTPSLHPSEILRNNDSNPEVMEKVTTVTDEFFRVCPAPIIGITGTKGKGTTSSLIAAILTKSGRRVHLGGNIGTPPLDLLKNNIQPDDIVVLELANFQLIDVKHSPHIGVVLMIAPEHLNWHKDMFEYVQSKRQMFAHQQKHDLAIYNGADLYSQEIADVSKGTKLTYEVPEIDQEPGNTNGAYVKGHQIYMYDEKICSTEDMALRGRHNLQNVCAAIAATWDLTNGNKDAMREVIKTFTGLPHRLQVVRDLGGVLFVDDSFGTTPETAVVALDSFTQPKVLIVGGASKNANYSELAQKIVSSNVKAVVAIGETGPKITDLVQAYARAVGKTIPCAVLGSEVKMPEIVATAAQQAVKGDVIMLSTGCASFGMFKNYEERGQQFQAAVNALNA